MAELTLHYLHGGWAKVSTEYQRSVGVGVGGEGEGPRGIYRATEVLKSTIAHKWFVSMVTDKIWQLFVMHWNAIDFGYGLCW